MSKFAWNAPEVPESMRTREVARFLLKSKAEAEKRRLESENPTKVYSIAWRNFEVYVVQEYINRTR